MGLFGALGGEPQTWVKGAVAADVAAKRRFCLGSVVVLSTLAAWFGMNDWPRQASFADQAVIFKRKHNWLMCWLYIGTFGSFIGFAAGFPLLVKGQFRRLTRANMCSSARWWARWPTDWRLAVRQNRRRQR